MSQDRPVILIISNENTETELMSQCFKDTYKNSILYNIDNITNLTGFLSKSADYQYVKTPDLIIYSIDIFDPSVYNILEQIKCKSDFKFIPMVMFLAKDSPDDIYKSYDKYVNACIIKPENIDDLKSTLNSVADFWMNIAKLPFNS